MSFIVKLAKGFVRSAVNQIGRDGGKVISNKIYKNSHATPIRVAVSSNNRKSSYSTSSKYSINNREDLKKAGYKVVLLQSNAFLYFFLAIGGGILPIVGPLYWFYLSFRNFFKRHTRFYHIIQKTVYVRDRRYKTGQRPNGYANVKEYSNVIAKPVISERIVFILKGLIALSIAISLASFQYSIYSSKDEPTSSKTATVAVGVVMAKHGLKMRTSAFRNAKALTSIPFNESVEIISIDGPEETIGTTTTNWMQVKYKDQTGWVWGGLIKTEK